MCIYVIKEMLCWCASHACWCACQLVVYISVFSVSFVCARKCGRDILTDSDRYRGTVAG